MRPAGNRESGGDGDKPVRSSHDVAEGYTFW